MTRPDKKKFLLKVLDTINQITTISFFRLVYDLEISLFIEKEMSGFW